MGASPLYDLFSEISELFHGVCLRLDCTETFRYAKGSGSSFFPAFIHRSLTAAQQVENFKTRNVDGAVWEYKVIHGGSAAGRANGTIEFGYYSYQGALQNFVRDASHELERLKNRNDPERYVGHDLIRLSVLPWFDFSSISHASDFAWRESAPRITFGKVTEAGERCTMPVSIHVHHAPVDGLHVAKLVEELERRLALLELL